MTPSTRPTSSLGLPGGSHALPTGVDSPPSARAFSGAASSLSALYLQALQDIVRTLSARSGQREMLSDILDVFGRTLQLRRGTVMMLSGSGQELVVEVAPEASPESKEVRYRAGEGITGHVLQTGKSAIVPLISKEPRFQDRIHRRLAAQSGEASFVCVPILLGNEVIGTLAVDVPRESPLVLEEVEQLVSIVAMLITQDLRNRRLAKLQRDALEAENLRLRDALGERFRPEQMVGNSRVMRDVYTRIFQVSASDTTVLIRGESGTGKEVVASAIHYTSPRAKRPFIKVNCAALSESLLQSELFGHERGAFTGAVQTRIGRIEEAEGGTLFLDEIGDFSPGAQVKLLRVLQEREFERVGSNKTIKADVRILAATNRDLEAAVRDGNFRQDLYYRINVFPIGLPPLRDRRDDVLLLANHFTERYSRKMGKSITRVSTGAIDLLLQYHWPGNVRELENCIEHAVLLSNDGVIRAHHLPPTLQMAAAPEDEAIGTLKSRVHSLERDMIVESLKRVQGNVTAAARELGITPRMVRYKLKSLQIDYQALFRGRQEG